MSQSIAFAFAATAAFFVLASPTLVPGQVRYNEVIRFGARDLVQSAKNPATQYALELPGAQPAGYMATNQAGVAAGTLTWIWYPSQLNSRLEDRWVTGHMIAVRPSSATPLSDYSATHPGQTTSGVPVYIPKFSVHPAEARQPKSPPDPFGPGFDPDFSKSPLFSYNTLHTPLVQPAQADQALLWTVTYNTSVKIRSDEMVLGFEWQGGEHYTRPRTQSLPTGWSESMFAPAHWGFAAPAPKRTITRFDPVKILPGSNLTMYSSPMGGYFEDQATICFHSDWGEERNPALAGLVYPSYNVGSGLCDAGSKAGSLGWDVFTSPTNQGMRAMPLVNLRTAPWRQSTPLLGRTFEVDPADPLLPLFWGNPFVDGQISTNGVWLPSKRLPIPKLGPAAIGLWMGMEFALVDAVGSVPESTQAYWFYIER